MTPRGAHPRRASWPFALLLLACGAQATGVAHGGAQLARLQVGETVDGSIDAADPEEEPGHHVDTYELALAAGERVRVRVASSAFDAWLRVVGPDGTVENDDALPGITDAMIQLAPDVARTYRVSVATAIPLQSGAYLLEVSALAPSASRLELGAAQDGVLRPRVEAMFGAHRFFDFAGEGGAVVRIRLTSADFDPIATLLGPNGERWSNADASALDEGAEHIEESALAVPLPYSGTYTLVVSSRGDVGGSFRFESDARAPVVVQPGEAAPRGPFAGPSGEGRVLGLYIGLSRYDELPDLYGAADDARFLGEAMRAMHLQRPDEQTILLDDDATRDAVFAALGSLVARAGPGDVALVFFAGHGDVQPVPPAGDPRELDGLDETIILADGPLTDTEVASALDGIGAAITLLALDSCHSGGFADDFVTRAGRVGLFSSEADAISDVALVHRAGGYLSWYLRRGVLGEADLDPRDGALSVGELTDFLHRGFVRDDAVINPALLGLPAQHPVIRRGAVPWHALLWSYPRSEDLSRPTVPDLALQSPPP